MGKAAIELKAAIILVVVTVGGIWASFGLFAQDKLAAGKAAVVTPAISDKTRGDYFKAKSDLLPVQARMNAVVEAMQKECNPWQLGQRQDGEMVCVEPAKPKADVVKMPAEAAKQGEAKK